MSPTFHSKVLIFRALAVIDNRLLNSLYWGSVSGFGLCCHDGFEVQVLGYFAACPRGLNVAMYLVLCCILYLYLVFVYCICAVFISCDVSCICILYFVLYLYLVMYLVFVSCVGRGVRGR